MRRVQKEFLATFRKVQRAGLVRSQEMVDAGVHVESGMSRATLYRELAALAKAEKA